jgi:FkbM family methyltransferase
MRFFDVELGRSQYLPNRIRSGEFDWLRQRDIKTVLDVGANTGQFATMINAILPEAFIYSFEPLEQCFKSLRQNTEEIENIQCFRYALGHENAQVMMHANEFSPSSSILEMADLHKTAFPYTKNSTEEPVEVRTLDSLLPQLRLRKNVLAKFDVQGYELNALRGGEEALTQIDILVVETSFYRLYENQPLFDDIYGYLSKKNFKYRGNLDQEKSATNGEVLQTDAIFTR